MKEVVFGTFEKGIRAIHAGNKIVDKTITRVIGKNNSKDGMEL